MQALLYQAAFVVARLFEGTLFQRRVGGSSYPPFLAALDHLQLPVALAVSLRPLPTPCHPPKHRLIIFQLVDNTRVPLVSELQVRRCSAPHDRRETFVVDGVAEKMRAGILEGAYSLGKGYPSAPDQRRKFYAFTHQV